MADTDVENGEDGPQKKKSKLPIILGLSLALILGGGGFYAVYSGMILSPEGENIHAENDSEEEMEKLPLPAMAFIPLQPLVINLTSSSGTRYLKFNAQLEVEPDSVTEVTELLPRVVDVLNGYLRAVSIEELERPSALIRLRAQMLRRVQIVTGEGRVRDLLVMEFVVN